MILNGLTDQERIQKYNDYNNPSPIANAGVSYIPNPTPESPKDISYLDAFNTGKMPLLNGTDKTTSKANLTDPMSDDDRYLFNGSNPLTPQPYKPSFLTSKQIGQDNVKEAYSYYVNHYRLPAHVAAGIVGNLYQESRLKTSAVEKGNTKAGRGIAQWDVHNRWPAYLKWAKDNGKDPYNLHSQLDYVLVEPGWGDTALTKTMNAKNADDATMIFGRSFERPKEDLAEWDVRKKVANLLLSGGA